MFNEDDYNHILNTQSMVPDGVINGSQYANIFKSLSNRLENINPLDFSSGIRWIMECVNECYEDGATEMSLSRASDVVTSLAYFCMTLHAAMIELGVSEEYFKHQNESVIPELFAECETIPWYDFSEKINMITDMMDKKGESETNE